MIKASKKIFFLLLFCLPVYADKSSLVLKHLNSKISVIKAAIVNERNHKSILQNELEKTETLASKTTIKLKKNQKNLQKIQKTLEKLTKKQNEAKQQLSAQQNLLAEQLRIAYMMGRQSYFQLLLNQKNINEFSRMLTYYKYMTENRLRTIKQIQTLLTAINQNQQRIQNQYQTLQLLGEKIKKQHQQLLSGRHYRQELIKKINHQITDKQQHLAELIKNQQQLTHTVSHLEETQTSNFIYKNFANLRGKLHWPTIGKVSHTFGTIISESELRWDGDLIHAKAGQDVYAIAAGKVIFAKWLLGYGLLLIINHGNGYMTLYGRNHTLYKQVGDTVKPGQLIATVGKTGGYQHPTLYFAIRHNGTPLDPQKWCQ